MANFPEWVKEIRFKSVPEKNKIKEYWTKVEP